MEYTIPHYFDRFRCVAAECEDTCCAGWQIMIDEDTLEKYRQTGGAIGNRIRNSVDWEKGCFFQYDKRCAFLNEDNLCDLHMEAGEHMLCNTCRDYPRHMEEFEGLREGSLSLSCIEAAKIILGCKEPVQFVKFEDDVEDEEYEDFDYLLFTKLMDAREKIIQVLQSRHVDIMTRISAVLQLAHDMQQALEEGELFRIDELLEQFDTLDETTIEPMGAIDYCATMRKMFRVFGKLEVLKEDWPDEVKKAERILYGEGQGVYEEYVKAFRGVKRVDMATWIEQLMVYFVFTYFCGAVYDDNILGKMQIAVVSTILILELSMARWIEGYKQIEFEQFVDIAHRVSRELEHSDLNITRLEKICEKMPIFDTKELLRVVLY